MLACGLLWSFSVRADLNIALIAPTDGDFKYFSEELVNGAKVAVDEINESGGLLGKKINLIQIDDPCDDTLSLTTAQMMAVNRSQEDKMHLVLGPHCSNQAEKIADIFAAAEIFQILPIGGSPAVYKKKLSQSDRICRLAGATGGRFLSLLYRNLSRTPSGGGL